MNKQQKIVWILVGILAIVILFTLFSSSCIREKFTEEKLRYDCIISINVHEKFDFLLKQLENIKQNVHMNYAVILNCNNLMFEECTKNRMYLSDNVYIHDKVLNKRTYHGSILEGIYNNIQYALDRFTFEYFIIASSRNFFTNINLEDLKNLAPTDYDKRDLYEKIDDWSGWETRNSYIIYQLV